MGDQRLGYFRFSLAGVTDVPVDVQHFETEADEWAHLVADNRIAELADMDGAGLGELLRDLGEVEDFKLDLTGFDEKKFEIPENDMKGLR